MVKELPRICEALGLVTSITLNLKKKKSIVKPWEVSMEGKASDYQFIFLLLTLKDPPRALETRPQSIGLSGLWTPTEKK